MIENPLIKSQYSGFPYPEPIEDLSVWLNDHSSLGDPSKIETFNTYWPGAKKRPLSILIAGCGTSQSAVIAYTNPDCQITAVDLSATSLGHTDQLKKRHSLGNLDLVELSLLEVSKLDQTFDLIISTGVLHHLADPVAGGRALAAVLKENGVMHLMLYGSTLRYPIYPLQRSFDRMGITQTGENAQRIKHLIENVLDKNHPIHRYVSKCRDLNYEAGIVDTFLNPQDTAYSVSEILQFTQRIGMTFDSWLDNGYYYIGHEPNFKQAEFLALFPEFLDLPLFVQAEIVDSLFMNRGVHRFNLVKTKRDYISGILRGTHGTSVMPALKGLQKFEHPEYPEGRIWGRHPFLQTPFALDLKSVEIFKLIQAHTPANHITETLIKNGATRKEAESQLQGFMTDMWFRGHLYFSHPDNPL